MRFPAFAASCAAMLLPPCHPGRAASVTIGQSGQAFSENSVALHVGDHLRFVNQDDVNHNIVIQTDDDDDDGHDMGVQPPGGAVDALFDKAGTFKVRCHIHPGMKLRVDVR